MGHKKETLASKKIYLGLARMHYLVMELQLMPLD